MYLVFMLILVEEMAGRNQELQVQ